MLVLDRDVNAARNIVNRGLEIGLGRAKYTPEGKVAVYASQRRCANRLGDSGSPPLKRWVVD
jgi:transposase